MFWRTTVIVGLCILLGGCSYAYDLLAVMKNGRVEFIVDPQSMSSATFYREVEVESDDRTHDPPAPGDDKERVDYGTSWFESVGYDDNYLNKFPIVYGAKLRGKHQTERGLVSPKPLRPEVIYHVSTTSMGSGYGEASFVIHSDGRVESHPGRAAHASTPDNKSE